MAVGPSRQDEGWRLCAREQPARWAETRPPPRRGGRRTLFSREQNSDLGPRLESPNASQSKETPGGSNGRAAADRIHSPPGTAPVENRSQEDCAEASPPHASGPRPHPRWIPRRRAGAAPPDPGVPPLRTERHGPTNDDRGAEFVNSAPRSDGRWDGRAGDPPPAGPQAQFRTCRAPGERSAGACAAGSDGGFRGAGRTRRCCRRSRRGPAGCAPTPCAPGTAPDRRR